MLAHGHHIWQEKVIFDWRTAFYVFKYVQEFTTRESEEQFKLYSHLKER